MAKRNEEQQQTFDAALRSIADEETLDTASLDALSLLEGADVQAFDAVWSRLAAPARARTILALRQAAEERLRLDFSSINYLALRDEDEAVRLAAVESALEDRSSRLLDTLLEMVRSDPSYPVRQAVVEDLSRFTLLAELDSLDADSTRRVRETLQALIDNPDEAPGVRSAAVAALGYFSDTASAELLAKAFADPDLRLGAIRGMGRSADPRWSDRLMPVLGSDDPDMRMEAAAALGEIEDERAIGPLTELADDPDRDVRLAVIKALGTLGGDEAREPLIYLLDDNDPVIVAAAERALSNMEEEEEDELL